MGKAKDTARSLLKGYTGGLVATNHLKEAVNAPTETEAAGHLAKAAEKATTFQVRNQAEKALGLKK